MSTQAEESFTHRDSGHSFINEGRCVPGGSDNPLLRLRMKKQPQNSRIGELILKSRLQIKLNFGETLCKRLDNIMHRVTIKMIKLLFLSFSK